MFDTLLRHRSATDHAIAPAMAAAAAIGRLDEALAFHPLHRAFLYRARLDAVRRQAAVDGRLIDPWQLAAVLEGLRLRLDGALPIIERLEILDAARHALALHQWLVAPDFDEEEQVQRAARHVAGFAKDCGTPLLAAAHGTHAWLASGRARAPLRAALIRFWVHHGILRLPVPLTGAAALRAETSSDLAAWLPAFLDALAGEAADARQSLRELEQAWFAARTTASGLRRDSHAAAAIDLLAAAPLISATTLAAALGVAVKTATRLLDGLVASGIAVEVTRRSKRRLFGLKGVERLADVARPPARPEPGRSRGRPPNVAVEEEDVVVEAVAPLPLAPTERRTFDYSDLEHGMVQLDLVIRRTRQSLDALVCGAPGGGGSAPTPGDADAVDVAPVPAIDSAEAPGNEATASLPAIG